MASKIHIFRKSAMEAGNPGKYYINPSEKLMSVASKWRVVEHEDWVEVIFNRAALEDVYPIIIRRYNNQAIGDSGNKDDDYSFIVNTDFLNLKGERQWPKMLVLELYLPKMFKDFFCLFYP
ncbi:hypothetical protein C5167_024230 [Papaver somniferum]|uniref:Uncharacterized protein n=1 Tax=Papaver somniferum TaxID=3469 RepID=A0A4Y7JS04_PAPSO|nr:uncharacterized protein LOC113277980 [Papaver somniferum]RZC62485.1 hypothetical protein C5167_024230 [Papaver somniferum]